MHGPYLLKDPINDAFEALIYDGTYAGVDAVSDWILKMMFGDDPKTTTIQTKYDKSTQSLFIRLPWDGFHCVLRNGSVLLCRLRDRVFWETDSAMFYNIYGDQINDDRDSEMNQPSEVIRYQKRWDGEAVRYDGTHESVRKIISWIIGDSQNIQVGSELRQDGLLLLDVETSVGNVFLRRFDQVVAEVGDYIIREQDSDLPAAISETEFNRLYVRAGVVT